MLLIKNGRVLDPATKLDTMANVLIVKDKIVKIGSPREVGAKALELQRENGEEIREILADGLVVAPGFVDVHVHFRDPGLTYKEDIHTGSQAAAAGGYTTVICMANTKPPVDSVDVLRDLRMRAMDLPIHVLNAANVTVAMQGQKLTDMDALYEAGACGFTDDGVPISDERLMREALKKAKKLDVPISVHEEDPLLMNSPGVNYGDVSKQLGLGGAPAVAETVLVARDCLLNQDIDAKLDIQHISAGMTVDILRFMKKKGVNVYGEVTPQHLYATEQLVMKQGSLARVNPPLRTEADRQALIDGVVDGTLDMIATDHAPHAKDEKSKPIEDAPSGMIGLETAFALCNTVLVKSGRTAISDLCEKMSLNPARLYGLDAGRLYEGGPADLVLLDPEEEWTVTEADFHSKSKNSPFVGEQVTGRVKYTICDGKIVWA